MNAALVLATMLLAAYAQLVWKARSSAHAAIATEPTIDYLAAMLLDPWIWTALLGMGIGVFTWMLALRRLDLSVAYPALAGVFVLVALGAHFFLGETVSLWRWVGLSLIISGITVVTLTA